ncbi:MAG: C-GCAxxG-C-C family protein [Candidatus Jettenia sp.]|nr:C-GCAxxG-C-C family protein [Candidatus Jettenia sp.]
MNIIMKVRCIIKSIHNKMKSKEAVSYYRGKENFNCAQAILKAYQEDFNITDQQIIEYKKFGGGKAEGGVCGALFAAKKLIHNEDISNQVEQHFSKAAGAITCREILSLKQLSCHKCVENIAESLDEYLKGKKQFI